MSAIWLQAVVPHPAPPAHSVFLTFDPDEPDGGVTRYLMAKFGGQILPCGIDQFETEADAKDRCQADLGIGAADWREIEEEPAFHAPVVEAIDEAVSNYLADAGQQVRERDDPALRETPSDDA